MDTIYKFGNIAVALPTGSPFTVAQEPIIVNPSSGINYDPNTGLFRILSGTYIVNCSYVISATPTDCRNLVLKLEFPQIDETFELLPRSPCTDLIRYKFTQDSSMNVPVGTVNTSFSVVFKRQDLEVLIVPSVFVKDFTLTFTPV